MQDSGRTRGQQSSIHHAVRDGIIFEIFLLILHGDPRASVQIARALNTGEFKAYLGKHGHAPDMLDDLLYKL
jgi:hypothetical protein